jgi:hypothetical protein
LNLSDFSVIKPTHDPRWWWLQFSPAWRARIGGDEAALKIMDGQYTSRARLQMKVMQGRKKADMMGHDGGMLIVSERFLAQLKKLKCTGLRSHPVTISDRRDEAVLDRDSVWLRLKRGIGRFEDRGFFDPASVGTIRSPASPYGLYFDLKSWTGLDLFLPARVRSMMLTTRRVGDAILAAGLTGVEVTPVTEYGRVKKARSRPPSG